MDVTIRSSEVCWKVDAMCCMVSTMPWRSCVIVCTLFTFCVRHLTVRVVSLSLSRTFESIVTPITVM